MSLRIEVAMRREILFEMFAVDASSICAPAGIQSLELHVRGLSRHNLLQIDCEHAAPHPLRTQVIGGLLGALARVSGTHLVLGTMPTKDPQRSGAIPTRHLVKVV